MLSNVIRAPVADVLAAGVRVAVQVIPPSDELRPLKAPLPTVKSAPVRPVTASLKVMVTAEVSPAVRVVSLTVIDADGRRVSMA